jgi:hypothetical protein
MYFVLLSAEDDAIECHIAALLDMTDARDDSSLL